MNFTVCKYKTNRAKFSNQEKITLFKYLLFIFLIKVIYMVRNRLETGYKVRLGLEKSFFSNLLSNLKYSIKNSYLSGLVRRLEMKHPTPFFTRFHTFITHVCFNYLSKPESQLNK